MNSRKDNREKSGDFAGAAVDEGNRPTEIAKRKFLVTSPSRKRDAKNKKTGEVFFSGRKSSDGSNAEEREKLCKDCDDLLERLEITEAEIEDFKIKITCVSCGRKYSITLDSCPFCGEKNKI